MAVKLGLQLGYWGAQPPEGVEEAGDLDQRGGLVELRLQLIGALVVLESPLCVGNGWRHRQSQEPATERNYRGGRRGRGAVAR